MTKMIGDVSNLLARKYRKMGFTLTEDEDFLYLSRPGQEIPYVYSTHGATIERIHKEIDGLLLKEK